MNTEERTPTESVGRARRNPRVTERLRIWHGKPTGGAELLAGEHILVETDRHTHPEYQVAVVTGGELVIDTPQRAYRGRAGAVLTCMPDALHAARSDPVLGWTGYLLSPTADQLVEAARLAGGRHVSAPPMLPAVRAADAALLPRVAALFRALADADGGAGPLEAETRLLGVLAHLTLGAGRGENAAVPQATRAVRRARAYLDAHVTAAVPLRALAEVAGASPWHLVRAFTREVGLPPHAYQMQRRIAAAKRALAAGRAVADVALDAGFAHQSHFTRHFSRYSDISPARYARLCRAGAARGRARARDVPDVRLPV